MKIKIVFALGSFGLTFLLSVVVFHQATTRLELFSLNQKSQINIQNKISNFLAQDLENRRIKADKLINRQTKSNPLTSIMPIEEYVSKIEAMNLAGLPEDFQIAWLRYAKASRDSVNFISNLHSLPNSLILNNAEKVQAEIIFLAETEAWNKVVQAAKSYNVNIKE